MARYAWVITQDLDNPYGEDNSLDLPTRVGLSGPYAATEQDILRALDRGEFFRLVDDDGHPYYIGRCWCADGPGSPEMFGPLDDWGRADVGATEVQYRGDGGWKSL